MIWEGARDRDEDLPLNVEWLARTAEIDGSWWLAPEPIRRRRVGRYVTAALGMACISILTIAALVAL